MKKILIMGGNQFVGKEIMKKLGRFKNDSNSKSWNEIFW